MKLDSKSSFFSHEWELYSRSKPNVLPIERIFAFSISSCHSCLGVHLILGYFDYLAVFLIRVALSDSGRTKPFSSCMLLKKSMNRTVRQESESPSLETGKSSRFSTEIPSSENGSSTVSSLFFFTIFLEGLPTVLASFSLFFLSLLLERESSLSLSYFGLVFGAILIIILNWWTWFLMEFKGLNENYLHDSFYMVKIVLWRLQSLWKSLCNIESC